jgi:hypothetical protein
MHPFQEPPFDPHSPESSREPPAGRPHRWPTRPMSSRRLMLITASLILVVAAVVVGLFVVVPNLPNVKLTLDDPSEHPRKKEAEKKQQ